MKSISKELESSAFFRLIINIRTAEEVYKAAVYGALHNEAQILHILSKTGLTSSEQELEKSRFKEALVAINAVSENEQTVELKFSSREIQVLRTAVKQQLNVVKKVPKLAREQLILTYATLVEGYVNDTIRNFLRANPKSLKSNKSTLKDGDLIDSIIAGNTLEKLIDNRVRSIMYDSISGWIKYLQDKGMNIKEEKALKKMFLVRNILIHNNKKVGVELEKSIGGRRYTHGRQVNVTENDLKRYKKAIKATADNINSEYELKLKKKTRIKNHF